MSLLFYLLVEAWKCLLNEKQNFYMRKNDEIALNILNDEGNRLKEISNKIALKNVYTNPDCNFFFKKSDI